MSGTRFRALRARGAREAGFFFTDQFLLMRRFQRGITRPWEGSGSVFYSADTQTDRQTGTEKRHYENIYIDFQKLNLDMKFMGWYYI